MADVRLAREDLLRDGRIGSVGVMVLAGVTGGRGDLDLVSLPDANRRFSMFRGGLVVGAGTGPGMRALPFPFPRFMQGVSCSSYDGSVFFPRRGGLRFVDGVGASSLIPAFSPEPTTPIAGSLIALLLRRGFMGVAARNGGGERPPTRRRFLY